MEGRKVFKKNNLNAVFVYFNIKLEIQMLWLKQPHGVDIANSNTCAKMLKQMVWKFPLSFVRMFTYERCKFTSKIIWWKIKSIFSSMYAVHLMLNYMKIMLEFFLSSSSVSFSNGNVHQFKKKLFTSFRNSLW